MTLNSALFQFVEPHASVYLGGFLKHPQSTKDHKCRKVLKITKKVSVLTTFILYFISLMQSVLSNTLFHVFCQRQKESLEKC